MQGLDCSPSKFGNPKDQTSESHPKNNSKGIVITDISEHLPIFAIKRLFLSRNVVVSTNTVMYRLVNEDTLTALYNHLSESNCHNVLTDNDSDATLSKLDIIKESYNDATQLIIKLSPIKTPKSPESRKKLLV